MVALPLLLMLPVVTENVAVVAEAATVTELGTVRVVLEFVRLTAAPPLGAGWVKVTVQVLEAFGPRLVGLHDTEEISTGAAKVTAVLAELLL